MINDLKHLQLTERDFQLMIEGLDAIPKSESSSRLLGSMLLTMLAPNKKEEEKAKIHLEKKEAQAKKANELLLEEIKILQGKLLMLKRYLKEQGALEEFYGIVNDKNPGE